MTSYKITSFINPKIKKLVQLRNRKDRDQSHETIIEGYRELLRAVESNVRLSEFYFCPDLLKQYDREGLLDKVLKLKIPMYEVHQPVFEKAAYGDRKEGCIAVASPVAWKLNDLKLPEQSCVVVVEKVEKPGNLGAMLRVCDGAGVDAVIVCEPKTDIYNPNAIRASVGTIFSVNVAAATNEEARNFLKAKKFKICATTPAAEQIYSKENLAPPLAIVVGSEDEGLTDFWIKNADVRVKIPMNGKADSLNVSVSTAILLYEALRQREL